MTRYNTSGIANFQIPLTQQGLISFDWSYSLRVEPLWIPTFTMKTHSLPGHNYYYFLILM